VIVPVTKQAPATVKQAVAAIIRALRRLGKATAITDIERALARNDVDGVVRAVPWELLLGHFQPLKAIISEATGLASTNTAVMLGFGGQHLLPRTQEWASQYMATMVTRVSDETKQAIRGVAMRAIEEGRHPYWASRQIRAMVGLTERQAIASDNYRRRLEADGMAGERLERMVERYDAQALRLRADNIARTEMHTAMSRGNQEGYEEGLRLGYLDIGTKRKWIVAEDERTCDRCNAMDGQEVGIMEPFTEPGGNGEQIMMPPLHCSCRCDTGLVFPSGEEVVVEAPGEMVEA